MAQRTIFTGIVRDVTIIGVSLAVIWLSLWASFGTPNPFYVVASGSMLPELEVYDILVVQGHAPFEEVGIGDVIVFDRPSDHNRVIVHRVVSITDDDPYTVRTKGDANSASIPGTDYPITEKEYIGTVVHVVPQVGYITQVIKPPVNYIIIVIIVGIMIAKQVLKNRKESTQPTQRQDESPDNSLDIGEVGRTPDSEYSRHADQGNPGGNEGNSGTTKKDNPRDEGNSGTTKKDNPRDEGNNGTTK